MTNAKFIYMDKYNNSIFTNHQKHFLFLNLHPVVIILATEKNKISLNFYLYYSKYENR